MSQELICAVWYHRVFGKSKRARKALGFYGSFQKFYEAMIKGTDVTGFSESVKRDKITGYSFVDAQLLIDECRDMGWEVIPEFSEYYPSLLLEIEDRPAVIFVDGDKEVLRSPVMIGVVGSREAEEQAEVIARNASYNLAKTGALIVSGAALGIDSSAHLGAIEAGGKTVGVLGCGLGSEYMNRIGDFYDRIKESGCFITEMFPFTNASRFSFPERNRIISGMSRAVLVSCAAENSGSLITARLAKKQNRRVYAIAPEICYSVGCEALLKEGAYTFYNAGDIAYPLKEFYHDGAFDDMWCNKPVLPLGNATQRLDMAIPKKKTAKKETKKPSEKKTAERKEEQKEVPVSAVMTVLSENAKKVYELLGENAVSVDSLVSASALKINQILMGAGELEMKKLIKKLPGSRIQKI